MSVLQPRDIVAWLEVPTVIASLILNVWEMGLMGQMGPMREIISLSLPFNRRQLMPANIVKDRRSAEKPKQRKFKSWHSVP
ncbi:MAG: hypothetical protein JWM11_1603 [Planctomycetaceae bacterium]|nr:hypothetical protein [Planctomycetaceae bacterium]